MRAHGTVSCYTGGCRQPECREAFRVYYRAWRQRRRAVGLPSQGRQGKRVPTPRVLPPRKVAAPSSSAAAAFVERTDPLVLQAIRRVFNGHTCLDRTGRNERRCPHMPMREREALDAWLQPRVVALATILADARHRDMSGAA